MNTGTFIRAAWRVLAILAIAAGSAEAQSSGEPAAQFKEFQRRLDHMAKWLGAVRPDPEAAGDSKEGGITLQQHERDVAALRDQFVHCLAGMKASIASKEESGTATAADKAQFKECVGHCETVLAKLNHMHLGAATMGSASRKEQWIVSGLEAHKKALAEIQGLAAKCPDMMHKTMACCASGKGSAAVPPSPAPPAPDAEARALKEFRRRLDFMASRMEKLQPDPEAVPDSAAGAVSLRRHAEDVASLRDDFARCAAKMKAGIAAKEESGGATDADRSLFKECSAHCDALLEKLNSLHMGAAIMGSVDRKEQWIVGGLEKHKQLFGEVRAMADECLAGMEKTFACCKAK